MYTYNLIFLFLLSPFQGFQVDINCKQLTVDFVNSLCYRSAVRMWREVNAATRLILLSELGAMNKSWQILQVTVTEKVSQAFLVHVS